MRFNGELLMQVSGIFMGMSPAPALLIGSIYAFWYEYLFFARMRTAHEDHLDSALRISTMVHYLKQVHYNKRYIDDIIHMVDPENVQKTKGLQVCWWIDEQVEVAMTFIL